MTNGLLSGSLETWTLDQIKPYPGNAKIHTPEQIEALKKSLTEFGYNQPIMVDGSGVIITGHGRFEAMKASGWTQASVIVSDMSESQAKAFRIADNKLAETGHDETMLAREVQSIAELYPDLVQVITIDQSELDALLSYDLTDIDTDIDNTPTARPDSVIDRSDKFQPTYQVVIRCKDEAQQEEAYNAVTDMGFECRIQTVDVG